MHKQLIVEPDWFKTVNPKSGISAKELFALFGYASVLSFNATVHSGRFPQPDFKCITMSKYRDQKHMWHVSTIRAEIARRNKLLMEKQ